MGRRVLRRHIWGYSVCLCPTKGTPGLNELRAVSKLMGKVMGHTEVWYRTGLNELRAVSKLMGKVMGHTEVWYRTGLNELRAVSKLMGKVMGHTEVWYRILDLGPK